MTVYVQTSRCAYDVRVNDVSILEDAAGLPVEVELPVNHWLCSGENVLRVRLSPLPEEDALDVAAECVARLQVRQSGTPRTSNETIATLRYDGGAAVAGTGFETSSPPGVFDSSAGFSASDAGDVTVGEVVVEPREDNGVVGAARPVGLTVPFPRWAWLDSEMIEAAEGTRAELLQAYEHIWAVLRAGDAGLLLPLFAERTRELAAAFHRTEAEMQHVLGLQRAVQKTDLELFPLDEDPELEVFGSGRLARVTRWDKKPLIVFVYSDGSASEYYDIVFRRWNRRWVITR